MSAVDFSSVRDEVVKLTQTVSDLVQKQASSARTQIMDAVGSAADNISQSTSAAQDKLTSLESEVGSSIQKNPWRAVVIAAAGGRATRVSRLAGPDEHCDRRDAYGVSRRECGRTRRAVESGRIRS